MRLVSAILSGGHRDTLRRVSLSIRGTVCMCGGRASSFVADEARRTRPLRQPPMQLVEAVQQEGRVDRAFTVRRHHARQHRKTLTVGRQVHR